MKQHNGLLGLLVMVCCMVPGSNEGRQDEFREVCQAFWEAWAAQDMESAVEVAAVPFVYCDGKKVVMLEEAEDLSRKLKALRLRANIDNAIEFKVKREFAFKELPIDSFRLTSSDRLKLKKFFNEDDEVFYVELKNIGDNRRVMYVLVVRWFNGKPKAIGILN